MADEQPRILFVEEDSDKRYAIARQLRLAGFHVDEAETGEQGMQLVTPEHDVAILDIELHDMRGRDLCKRLKENPDTASIKVLELAATLASAEDRARGLELGADCYLVHPVELVELVAAVRALVGLRRAERGRLRAQELLIATLGHDLRNPLNVISTGLSALSESPTLGPDDRNTVLRIDRTVERMRRMIDQLMVFAQTLGGEVVPVSQSPIDLVGLVAQVVRDLRSATKHPCDLESTLERPVHGDPDQLTRLVENLVMNAIHHGEGVVTVRLTGNGDDAVLSVHNGGSAIAEDMLPKLFEPFTRTKRSAGAGLGLYIVDQIARTHRGKVSVSSTEADGTTFTVRLPLSK
ncbi:MAG TPA: ATP-binding protein [Kofleriaceae bacterium]|nr:ATP-binding protein [Kofleriaceae bacterium]